VVISDVVFPVFPCTKEDVWSRTVFYNTGIGAHIFSKMLPVLLLILAFIVRRLFPPPLLILLYVFEKYRLATAGAFK
jgi:hypothetical protein